MCPNTFIEKMTSDKTRTVRWLSYLISVLLIVLISIKLISHFHPRLFNSTTLYSNLIGEVKEHDLDIVFGSDTAPLTVYLYSHYTCKYCVKFFQEEFPKIEEEYINTGKVRFVLKFIELGRNQDVLYSLQAAVCVNKYGSFEKLHKLLLADKMVVFTQEFKNLISGFIGDNSDVAECILNNNNYNYLYANNREFMQLGLKGTPTFIINKHVYSGYRSYRDFEKILDKESVE